MTISFVVPTRNRAALLEQTLLSILGQTLTPLEIIVVDNGSTDDTAARVDGLRRTTNIPISFHVMAKNGGPASSRNHGAKLARGEFIAFIDSDVEIAPDWLTNALAAMNETPGAGMVAAKVVFAASPDTTYCFGGALSRIGFGWDAHQAEPADSLQAREPSLWTPSASMLVRRHVFVELDGFDETYFYGYEDSDLGWRFNLAGWSCICTPDALAIHATTDQIDDRVRKVGDEIVFHYTKNRLRSLLKNYSALSLIFWLPFYAMYSVIDATLRPPRTVKWRALWWNIANLGSTLSLRARAQVTRRCSDSQLAPLFQARLFPPQPLQQRMEAMRVVHGSAREPRGSTAG